MRKHGLPLLWVVSGSSLILSIVTLVLLFKNISAGSIQTNDIFNFIGITIGAVALVATVGFLVLAFPIWGEMSEIANERKEITSAREETERLQRLIRGALDDINAPYSRYTDLYQSLQLFSLVIRYIGIPVEQESPSEDIETDSERIERHVSMVRHLMASMAIEPDKDPASFLSLIRDAVGHLRETDDVTFFDFIESRLNSARPTSEDHKRTREIVWQRFSIVRGRAAAWRR